MDLARFDTLLHSLTATCSRRGLSRTLAGLTLGGALAPLLASDDGEAKKGKKNKDAPPPMDPPLDPGTPPMDPPLEPGTPPMEPPPRRRRSGRRGGWFQP